LDVGWFNNRYFVSQLHIPPSNIAVEYDEKFKVSAKTKWNWWYAIYNLMFGKVRRIMLFILKMESWKLFKSCGR